MENSDDKKLKPSIFDYHDYRQYLIDIATHYSYTSKSFGETIGASHGYFSNVLKQKRNLSNKMAEKLAASLALTQIELQYLKQLTTLSDSASAKKRNTAFKFLKKHTHLDSKRTPEFNTYKYLDKWHYVVIRELVKSNDFKYDPKWIQNQLLFPLRSREIKEALEFLKSHQFIEKKESRWVQSQKNLKCGVGVFSLSITNFHINILELAKKSIEKFRRSERIQKGYTLNIDKNDFEKIKDIVDKAISEIKAVEEKSKPSNSVYHINFSAFPFAKIRNIK